MSKSGLGISEESLGRLRPMPDKELEFLEYKVQRLYESHFSDGDGDPQAVAKMGLKKEDVLNTAQIIWREMIRRGLEIDRDSEIFEEVEKSGDTDALFDPTLRDDIYETASILEWEEEDRNVDAT